MGIAPDAAPETDRLVLSVNRGVYSSHGARLLALAKVRGLNSLELLPHFGDFLLAGTLTRELAVLRMRYWLPEGVLGRLDDLERKQLIHQRGSRLAATPSMRPLLEALRAAQADVAAQAWGDHNTDVGTATGVAGDVIVAASDDHVVAVAHRALPEPSDPYLLLHYRLTTLRYIRQHDHAMAWLARDLTAPAMVVMTELWHDGHVEAQSDGLTQLIQLGLATVGHPTLTPAGRDLRDAIEADTDRRTQETFNALDDQAANAFLDALKRLPGTIE